MNGHGTEPPDKHQSNAILVKNELVLCEMEIKQEPNIKEELEDDDGFATVVRLTHASDVSTQNSIGSEQVGSNNDFADFCVPNEVKLKVKIEKSTDKANQVPQKSFEKYVTTQNMNRFSKSKKQKTNGWKGGAKKNVTEARKCRTNTFGDKKSAFAGGKHNCTLCGYVTDIKVNLNRHMLKHTGEKPHKCTICPKRFTRKQHLQSHMKIHVAKFAFSCSVCFQGLNHNEEKVEHEADCTVRRYECHLCKEFSTLNKTNLVEHLRVHTGDKPFQCKHCSKKFTRAHHLKDHRKTHINPRPLKFKCSVCFKNFKQQTDKENHEANCKRCGHKCDLCKIYTTNDKRDLVKHMRIHTGEKPFQCEVFSKCFTHKTSLNRHKKIHK